MTTTHTKSPNNVTTSRAPESKMNERIADSIDSATAKIVDVVEEKGSVLADTTSKLVSDASDKARYLRESEPRQLGSDLLAVIKRHPVLSLAIGTGLGMMLSRRRRRRG